MLEGWYVQDKAKAYVAGPFGRRNLASKWVEDRCPPLKDDPRASMAAYASYAITYVREGVSRPYKAQPTEADCRAADEAVEVLIDLPPFPLSVYGVLSHGLEYNAISATSSCLDSLPGLPDATDLKLIAWVDNTPYPRWYLTSLGYLAACVMKEGFYAG